VAGSTFPERHNIEGRRGVRVSFASHAGNAQRERIKICGIIVDQSIAATSTRSRSASMPGEACGYSLLLAQAFQQRTRGFHLTRGAAAFAQMLKAEIGRRPVLVTIEEAGKLYALAWLLADLKPDSDAWSRVIARFPARCNRAGALWASTCYLDQGPDTAALFRSLVFRERSEGHSLGRIVIDRPDFDVFEKVVMAQRRRQRRLRELPQGEQIRWGGILCKKLSTVMLLPVDRSSRPISGSAP
jgi:hypothetical protein